MKGVILKCDSSLATLRKPWGPSLWAGVERASSPKAKALESAAETPEACARLSFSSSSGSEVLSSPASLGEGIDLHCSAEWAEGMAASGAVPSMEVRQMWAGVPAVREPEFPRL